MNTKKLVGLLLLMLCTPASAMLETSQIRREFHATDFDEQIAKLEKTGVHLLGPNHKDIPDLWSLQQQGGWDITRQRGEGQITVRLLAIDDPPVTSGLYGIVGEVAYHGTAGQSDLSGEGYLETWNYFANGSKYFTRTLADAGPMQKLSKSSAMRRFELPFQSNDNLLPTRIEMNLVLRGTGTVSVRSLKLVQMPPRIVATPSNAGTHIPPWFVRNIGLIQFILVIALLACVMVMRSLMQRGKGKPFVLGVFSLILIGGAIQLVAAIMSILWMRPPNVTLSLLAGAAIMLIIPALSMKAAVAHYRQLELKRMQALDLA
jgi:hypothetical protein